MGQFFSSPETEQTPDVDWEALEGELLKVMKRPDHDDGTLGPILLRLAWHSSGTYCAKSRTGGSNGATMRHALEAADPENAGLDKARAFLEPVKKKFPNVSYADLWIFAAYVFLEASGGPKMVFTPGRKDKGAEDAIKPGRLPEAEHGICPGVDKEGRANGWEKNAHHIRQVFYRMGLNDQELTALLCGGHVYGRCHVENSGYAGPWVVEPWRFSNEYAEDMLNDRWEHATWDKMPEGKENDETVRPARGKGQYVGFPADEDEDEEEELKLDDENADFPLGRYAVNTTWVNVRETPEVNSPIMGRPKTGEVFDIIATMPDAGKSIRGRLAIGGWVSLRGSGGVDLFERKGDLALPTGKYRITGEVPAVFSRTDGAFKESDGAKPAEKDEVKVTEIVYDGDKAYGQLESKQWLCLVAPGQAPYYDRIQMGWNDQPRSIRFADIPTQMMLVSDMVLLWDAGFKKWLEVYGDEENGEDRLREDFGKAFKKLTELGFTEFPEPLTVPPFAGSDSASGGAPVSKCPIMA